MIANDRRARLIGAMADAGLDTLLVYGNAWQGDYLRYATDFGILEGQALALVAVTGMSRSISTARSKSTVPSSIVPASR